MRLDTRSKEAKPLAIRTGKGFQAQRTCSASPCGRYGVSVQNDLWPTRCGVYQENSGLMRLASRLAVTWPESGSLETQQILVSDVACLDSKDATGMQLLSNNREHTTSTSTVEYESFTDCTKYVLGLQGEFDGFLVEQKELRVGVHKFINERTDGEYWNGLAG